VGEAVRGRDRLSGDRQVRQHFRRDGQPDAAAGRHPVRRGVGLRGCDEPPDRKRRRRADRRQLVPRVHGRHAVAAGTGSQHRGRGALRRPVHVGSEHPHVQHRRGEAGPDELERRLRGEFALCRQDHGVRQPDLHRRCGDVSHGASARPRDHRSIRADVGSAERGRGPAEDAVRHDQEVLGRVHRRDRRVRVRRHGRRHGLAREPVDPRERQQGARRLGHPLGRRHGVGRHLDDVVARSSPGLHAEVDGVHAPSGGADGGGRVLRCDAVEHGFVPAAQQGPRSRRGQLPLRRRRVPVEGLPVEDPAVRLRGQPRRGLRRLLGVDERLDADPRGVGTGGARGPRPPGPSTRP
jgi:hypothetical protein